ncbi:GTPase [Alicyclobacillus sp.]|uniref:GTPase n=1 Tax=Alicyclobacillus sp. TaxID=61169 RepID=UPI0025BB3B7C|nr:GTPase [Alicyclobacillus sp.]MCL6515971.1 50S ribosome-binding GTPase [Alicyclobacillus sp.]
MEEANVTRICTGCGAALQTEAEDAPGYVPPGALERDEPLCRRCFRIRHYGEVTPVSVPASAYREVATGISRRPGLVLYVLDVFDLAGSLLPGIGEWLRDSTVWAVVNKVDLLPQDVRTEALGRFVGRLLARHGVRCDAVWLVSGRTGAGLREMMDALGARAEERVYAVGTANVGKSTLLNRLLQSGKNPVLTESRMPGTTLGVVDIRATLPSGREIALVDTPGLEREGRLIDLLCPDCLKRAVPSSRLRPRVYQLDPRQSLWIAGFARFDFLAGVHQPVVVYVSNDLVVHRTKLERAEVIGELRHDEVLQVPCAACRARLGEFTEHAVGAGRHRGRPGTVEIEVPREGCDVVLAGLGWITLFGRDLAGRVLAPPGVEVSVRERMIGGVTRERMRRMPHHS